MKCQTLLPILVAVLALSAPAQQGSRTVAAGLFKNGLAVITKEYTVPGAGSYTFDALGSPVHGTLWMASEAKVVARAEEAEVELGPKEAAATGLHEALLGKAVAIGLRLEDTEPFTGTLIAVPGGPGTEVPVPSPYRSANLPAPAPMMYVLDSGGLKSYIAADQVAYVTALEATGPVLRRKPVLVFEVAEGTAAPVVIRVRYLARGLSWAPAYRLDLSDPATLAIAQSAVIRNELEDLEDVEVELISGFPNVEFAQAISPFAADATWDAFFAQLQQSPERDAPVMAQRILSNTLVTHGGGLERFPTLPPDDGADLYYQAIGARSLKRGAAITLETGTASAGYERIVEWRIDQAVSPGSREDESPSAQENMWDAVRFKNPFTFPMTTGPAMAEANGRFLGSRTTFWANPGEETLAYVSKALSLRGTHSEKELERNVVNPRGIQEVQSKVSGTISLHNLRSEAAVMVIHKEISGEVVRADGEPGKVVGKAGPGQRNASTKLTWNLTLAPGETRDLVYEYHYLVN